MGVTVGKQQQIKRNTTITSISPIESSEISDDNNSSLHNLIVSSLSFNIHDAKTYEQILTTMWQHMPNRPRKSYEEASRIKPNTVVEFWKLVRDTSYHMKYSRTSVTRLTTMRRRWKTIRLFVSSTFRDFHAEREVLVKKVFPELRIWCEARKFHLIDCDLRWGVPKDTTSEETIRICLSELDRCYEDNHRPFFLNMISGRVGWIPSSEEISPSLAKEYGWIKTASVTEMEIIHGSIRRFNPNALFMIRHPSYLDGMPEDIRKDFTEEDAEAMEKVDALKTCLKARFPVENVATYRCQYSHFDHSTSRPVLIGLEGGSSNFANKVLAHFKEHISKQYPMNCKSLTTQEARDESHEAFLISRSSAVLGRDDILKSIQNYLFEETDRGILAVCGEAGAGKSAVIAKSAEVTIGKLNQKYHLIGKKKWSVFYHFIGAAPGSTDITNVIQRFLKKIDYKGEIPTDVDSIIRLMANVLSSNSTKPVIIFIDAVNQLDENAQAQLMTWLPQEPAPYVKVVFSVITDTVYHNNLMSRVIKPKELICGSLETNARSAIVKQSLAKFNKQLDDEQLAKLLSKKGSSNPLWLSVACEELRVFGIFDKVTEKIDSLADDVVSLLEQVLTSFEVESGGILLIATVCLLECSRHGLLETEILSILGSIDGQLFDPDKGLTGDEIKHCDSGNCPLPAAKWAVIFRSLKPYLRPCGESGEGRLDFYHRSVSKAVRKKYFNGNEDENNLKYRKWHKVLAEYFELTDNVDRKAEELPFHLEKLNDPKRLAHCLQDWPVFLKLSKDDNSSDLLKFWQMAGGYDVAAGKYQQALAKLQESEGISIELAEKKEAVARFLCRAGQLSTAQTMIEEVIDIEMSSLGKRKAELADLLQLSAEIHSEIIRLEGFIKNDLYQDHLKVIDLATKSIKNRKSSSDKDQLLGKAELLLALHCGGLARMDESNANKKHKDKADVHCKNAMKIFEKLTDIGHVAECYMTYAVFVCELGSDLQLQNYNIAYNLCKQAYGEDHILMLRIQNNMGIMYEHKNDYNSAYMHYMKWHEICINVLGPKHPKTDMAYRILQQPVFSNMSKVTTNNQERIEIEELD